MIRLLSLLAPLLLFALPSAAREPTPHPALWRVADEDTVIWLFGTVHVLPPDLDWRGGAVGRAIAEADTLIVEAVPDEGAGLAATMMTMATATDLPPLAARVPPSLRPGLESLLAKTPVPPAVLDRMKTWFAVISLMAPTIAESGMRPESGADRQLIAEARARGRPVIGLETAAQQLGFFDTLDEDQQRRLLASVIEDAPDARQEFHDLLAAWSRGDVAALEELADSDLKATPELRQRLLVARNRAWAAALRRRLDQPGTVLVAVGAAHLAGADSVQAQLERMGLRVTRVQ